MPATSYAQDIDASQDEPPLVGAFEAADRPYFGNGIATYADTDEGDDSEQIEITTVEINSADDLRAFRGAVNGTDHAALVAQHATVNLNCGIDLGGEDWVPIGTSADPSSIYANSFKGVFNGNGHTISNFKITGTNLRSVGLFSVISSDRKKYEGFEDDIAFQCRGSLLLHLL